MSAQPERFGQDEDFEQLLTPAEQARQDAVIAYIRDLEVSVPLPRSRSRFARFTRSYFGGGRIPRLR